LRFDRRKREFLQYNHQRDVKDRTQYGTTNPSCMPNVAASSNTRWARWP
jgi:hypothetical protein